MADPSDDENAPLNPGEEDNSLNYNQAITSTIDYSRPFMGKLSQITILFVSLSALNSANFLILGLPFMKAEP